jgi:BlaI family penicillinase repressor
MKKDLESYILTPQELRIMKVIWERGGANVKEICDVLSRRRETAYTTVLTFVNILERKGVLERRRQGRRYFYRPIFTKPQAIRNQVDDLLSRYFENNPKKLLETLVEYKSTSNFSSDKSNSME